MLKFRKCPKKGSFQLWSRKSPAEVDLQLPFMVFVDMTSMRENFPLTSQNSNKNAVNWLKYAPVGHPIFVKEIVPQKSTFSKSQNLPQICLIREKHFGHEKVCCSVCTHKQCSFPIIKSWEDVKFIGDFHWATTTFEIGQGEKKHRRGERHHSSATSITARCTTRQN